MQYKEASYAEQCEKDIETIKVGIDFDHTFICRKCGEHKFIRPFDYAPCLFQCVCCNEQYLADLPPEEVRG